MSVAPSAAAATPAPATAARHPRVAARRRCLITMGLLGERGAGGERALSRSRRRRRPPPGWALATPSRRADPASGGDDAAGDEALELVGRERPGDVEALRERHAVRGEALERVLVLDP